MNNLKNWAYKTKDVYYFLTYADNFAVGFFSKQGFTTDVGLYLTEAEWKGYIKDYDGGTLMICKFDPDIDYTNIQNRIEAEIRALQETIDTISSHMLQYQLNMGMVEDHETIPITLIPGLAESKYQAPAEDTDDTSEADAKVECFNYVIEYMLKHSASWPFKEPVKSDVAPDYYQTIPTPVDLATMKQRVAEGYYDTIDKFT